MKKYWFFLMKLIYSNYLLLDGLDCSIQHEEFNFFYCRDNNADGELAWRNMTDLLMQYEEIFTLVKELINDSYSNSNNLLLDGLVRQVDRKPTLCRSHAHPFPVSVVRYLQQ